MKKGISAKLFAIAALGLTAASASAQEAQRAWYVGGGIGTTHARSLCDNKGSLACDQHAGAWSIFAGYQFNPHFALEAGRVRINSLKMAGTVGGAPANAAFDSKAFDLVAVGTWPVYRELSAYGKAGAYAASSSFNGSVGAGGFHGESQAKNWTVGLGAQLDFERAALRGEWQRFHHVTGGTASGIVIEPGDIDVWSLQLLFRF